MSSITAPLSAALSSIFPRSPFSPSAFKSIHLEDTEESMKDGTTEAKGGNEPWEKCELHLEGMTCGACVEVSATLA